MNSGIPLVGKKALEVTYIINIYTHTYTPIYGCLVHNYFFFFLKYIFHISNLGSNLHLNTCDTKVHLLNLPCKKYCKLQIELIIYI